MHDTDTDINTDINTDTDIDTGTVTCPDCEEVIDTASGAGEWSGVQEQWYCQSCAEAARQYLSVAHLIEPDGAITRYYVNDIEVITMYGDDATHLLHRAYYRTDGWRGQYGTAPVAGTAGSDINGNRGGGDWVRIAGGWTTGGWDDAIARSKQAFNQWAEDVIAGRITPPCPMWIITDPTSNVFSTMVGVWVPGWAAEDSEVIDYLDVPSL